jgi:hypothetical protein
METNSAATGETPMLAELDQLRRRARGDQRRASLALVVIAVFVAGLGLVDGLTGGVGLARGAGEYVYAFFGLPATLAVLAVAHYRRSARLGAGPGLSPYAIALVAVWLGSGVLLAVAALVAPLGACGIVLIAAAVWARSLPLAAAAVLVGVGGELIRWVSPSVAWVEVLAGILLAAAFVVHRWEGSP